MQAKKDLLNNRYQKVKRLGEGSYGVVYLAIDTMPQGGKRLADPKALKLLDQVGKDEEATKVLRDHALIFQDNDAFAKQAPTQDSQVVVAIKKFKITDINVSALVQSFRTETASPSLR